MSTTAFGLGVLVTALAGVVAVLSSRVSARSATWSSPRTRGSAC